MIEPRMCRRALVRGDAEQAVGRRGLALRSRSTSAGRASRAARRRRAGRCIRHAEASVSAARRRPSARAAQLDAGEVEAGRGVDGVVHDDRARRQLGLGADARRPGRAARARRRRAPRRRRAAARARGALGPSSRAAWLQIMTGATARTVAHASARPPGRARQRPRYVAWPGPFSRNERTAPWRSSVANRSPASSGTRSSAARAPPSTWARTIAFVAACARVGPSASPRAKAARGRVEALVGQDAVDDVPALERGGVEQLAGHDELARAGRPGALGEALGAAHRRRQADDGLDQAEARGLGGEQQVAGERELERRRQAQRVGGEHGRQRQLLDGVDEVEQLAPQRRRPPRPRGRRRNARRPRRSPRGPRRGRAGRAAGRPRRRRPPRAARRTSPRRRGSAAGGPA